MRHFPVFETSPAYLAFLSGLHPPSVAGPRPEARNAARELWTAAAITRQGCPIAVPGEAAKLAGFSNRAWGRIGRVRQALKARMRAGEAANGFWVELFSPAAAEAMAAAGYDCAMIDLEHGAADLADAVAVMRAMAASDCTPLVRVPANDAAWIKRVLDGGAEGVMVPAVNSAEEAAAAVAACHYAPRGIRGMAAPIVRAAGYGVDWRGYVADIATRVLVICQVETQAAVDDVAGIVAVDGLDMIFLGPFDLSASLGYMGEPDHPHVRQVIAAVEAAAKGAGLLLGGIPTPGRSARELYQAGYDLVLGESDLALVRDGARDGVAALREAAGRR